MSQNYVDKVQIIKEINFSILSYGVIQQSAVTYITDAELYDNKQSRKGRLLDVFGPMNNVIYYGIMWFGSHNICWSF